MPRWNSTFKVFPKGWGGKAGTDGKEKMFCTENIIVTLFIIFKALKNIKIPKCLNS